MKTMMLAILILVLPLTAVAGEADDRMFQMLTAPRTPGAREASNRMWSEMAATLRREGAQLTVQADKSVTLTQNYADGRLFWMRSTTTGSRETCTAMATRTWCSDFDTGGQQIYAPEVK